MKTETVFGVPVANDRYSLLQNIVNQLESCHYEGEGGALEKNPAFIELKEQAQEQLKQPQFILTYAKYPKIGYLKSGLFDSVKSLWPSFPRWTRIVIEYHVSRISRSINFIDKFEKKVIAKLKNKNAH